MSVAKKFTDFSRRSSVGGASGNEGFKAQYKAVITKPGLSQLFT
jgi:hypothetical protein